VRRMRSFTVVSLDRTTSRATTLIARPEHSPQFWHYHRYRVIPPNVQKLEEEREVVQISAFGVDSGISPKAQQMGRTHEDPYYQSKTVRVPQDPSGGGKDFFPRRILLRKRNLPTLEGGRIIGRGLLAYSLSRQYVQHLFFPPRGTRERTYDTNPKC